MKTFIQYITEEPTINNQTTSKRYIHTQGPRLLGKIGRYEIYHHQDERDSSTAFITHNGKTIGNVPLGHYGKKVVPEGPSIHPAHRGGKAKVKNLMPKVYAMIADKLGKTIESDNIQTKGSASVWARLAKMRKLKIAHRRGLSLINHPVAGIIDAADYNEHRRDHNFYLTRLNRASKMLKKVTKQNDRAAMRDFNSDVNHYTRLVNIHRNKYGIEPGKKMPSVSKASRANLNGKIYVPSQHEKLVYHPTLGNKFTLKLEPKSRGK